MLRRYIKSLLEFENVKDLNVENLYLPLKILLEKFLKSEERKNIHVSISQKASKVLNPDFRISNVNGKTVGYIEAILPGTDFERILNSKQIRNNHMVFANIILTDFYEFRLFRNSKMIDRVELASRKISLQGALPPVKDSFGFYDLLDLFFDFIQFRTYTASSLSDLLKIKTGFLELVIRKLTKDDREKIHFPMLSHELDKQLKEILNNDYFAKFYSKIIVYSLFDARTRTDEDFIRRNAYECVSNSDKIIYKILKCLSSDDLDDQIAWIIDYIVEVLDSADIENIMVEFYDDCIEQVHAVCFFEKCFGIDNQQYLKTINNILQNK